ncbi:GH3 auxin-responsive promoter family protein [Paludisphaera sp.]|uniref:GH3 family domain-containing protein n=1 Tax=Paludisphaera sp. TaxID=2017432 RepID=UPI00301D2397
MTGAVAALAGAPPVRKLVNRAFHVHARLRMNALARLDPIREQERTIRRLTRHARGTRFGRDHGFESIRSADDFRRHVPIRTYEDLWDDYLRDRYPVFEDLAWPGRIPYLALTSGTTRGGTKYIPVSREMVRSNRKAAQTVTAAHMTARPGSRLFEGRVFFLGGTTRLEEPAPGVRQGDLSGVAAIEVADALRPYTFPPLDLALESDWDRKLERLADRSIRERVTLVSGVPSWLLMLFRRVLEIAGRSTVAEVWPRLELVVHGGVKFDPYRDAFREAIGSDAVRLQETYPCSEGFIAFGDPASGLLRLLVDHGIFYEFIPLDEYREGEQPRTRLRLGEVETGVDYVLAVSTCAGMWAHVIGDVVRFESLSPPLLRFVGRTKDSMSAFGEHLIAEEVEGAILEAARACGASAREWHVGTVFGDELGHHLYVIEFDRPPADPPVFRAALDAALGRRNDDYRAHRGPGSGIPAPAVLAARPGTFEGWMRRRGKLGGQNKVPRMDASGALTRDLADYARAAGLVDAEVGPAGG